MINAVVEGDSDTAMAESVIKVAGREPGRIIVKGGKSRIDPLLTNYNRAARHGKWVVFRDSDGECPVRLRSRLLADVGDLEESFSLRIAHTMMEAWLLADPTGISEYFSISLDRIPSDVEALRHAKRHLVDLCATSRSRAIRQDMVGPDRHVGPLYVVRINDFVRSRWSAEVAAQNSNSLRRAVVEITKL